MKKLIVLTFALTLLTPATVNAEPTNTAKTVRIYAMPMKFEELRMGSGFFIEDGRIITNEHVTTGYTKFLITDGEGNTYNAKLVADDNNLDLAVLETEAVDHSFFELAETVSNQQSVSFIGSGYTGEPFQQVDTTVRESSTFMQMTKNGKIAYSGQRMTMYHDAAPGYSGGPVFDQDGKIVGVMEASGGGSVAVRVSDLKTFIAANPVPEPPSLTECLANGLKAFIKRYKERTNHD